MKNAYPCFAAFRSALSPTLTLGLLLLLFTLNSHAAQINLAWNASTSAQVSGYKVHYGESSRQYDSTLDVGNRISYTVPSLADGKTYYFAVTAYDASLTNESAFSNEVSATIPNAPPVVATTTLPNGTVSVAYSATLAASGGTVPYTWSASALPAGLSLNTNTGAITGTPTTAGTTGLTVQVTDSATPTRRTASRSLSVTISTPAIAAPQITTTSLPGGTVGVAYSATLAVSGGTSPYTWSRTSGALPTGLSLNASTGTITGTPTTAGTASFTVQVTDAAMRTASKSLSISVTAPSTPIGFVQVAAATPQFPTQNISVTYRFSQTRGNFNVVVVGWNDTTAKVQSVQDSAGNRYNLAIGPTSGTNLRQSIYYAPNIVGGNNMVTVSFSRPAVYPDIRIVEYRGLNRVNVTRGGSGNSASANSGSATTTVANALVFGANTVRTGNAGPGSGFTARIITTPDGDLVEDHVVSTIGSYSATAPLTSTGPWVMQMVVFTGQ